MNAQFKCANLYNISANHIQLYLVINPDEVQIDLLI